MNDMEYKRDIKSLTIDELTRELTDMHYPSFRARQIYQWMHEKLVGSFEEMTNLPLSMREDLAK